MSTLMSYWLAERVEPVICTPLGTTVTRSSARSASSNTGSTRRSAVNGGSNVAGGAAFSSAVTASAMSTTMLIDYVAPAPEVIHITKPDAMAVTTAPTISQISLL